MPPSDAMADTARPGDDHVRPVDASDLFEQMLEAEIMGSGSYGADPDLDLIEARLSQLRQGPETPVAAVGPVLEVEPASEMEPDLEVEQIPEIERQQIATPPPAPAPSPATVRLTAPPVVVGDNRPASLPKRATSADAVVIEAARAAGVAPSYRQPGASRKSQAAPAPRKRRKRHSGLPSFYFAVLGLLLVSFALFVVWRPAPEQVIALPDELAGNIVEVVPAIPTLPAIAAQADAALDPQITASVSELPTAESAGFAAAASPAGYAARRIVKLYRVDAQGNIIGYTPNP